MRKYMIGFLVIVILLIIVIQYYKPRAEQPERPESVPASAVWDGGVDGGNWIDCQLIDSLSSVFDCTVYEDFNGEILFKGNMKFEGEKISLTELRKILGVYGGSEIYLKNGKKLIALDEQNQFSDKKR